MVLSSEEAALFFKLMLPLQFFVNGKLGILPKAKTFKKYVAASMNDKYKVRNALFENTNLIDEFIDENPHDIPLKELASAAQWKNFMRGDFYVERHLKSGSIFISEDDKVYQVLGLTDSIDKFCPSYTLPTRVNAILLPFQNQIIHDGFLAPYNVYFGSGIKRDLKEIYTKAKQKGKIIKAL